MHIHVPLAYSSGKGGCIDVCKGTAVPEVRGGGSGGPCFALERSVDTAEGIEVAACMCACVCAYVYGYVYVCICVYVCMCLCIWDKCRASSWLHVCMCVYACMHVCAFERSADTEVAVCMHVCVYVCEWVACVCVCMRTYTLWMHKTMYNTCVCMYTSSKHVRTYKNNTHAYRHTHLRVCLREKNMAATSMYIHTCIHAWNHFRNDMKFLLSRNAKIFHWCIYTHTHAHAHIRCWNYEIR
jgi:hypothetical protein